MRRYKKAIVWTLLGSMFLSTIATVAFAEEVDFREINEFEVMKAIDEFEDEDVELVEEEAEEAEEGEGEEEATGLNLFLELSNANDKLGNLLSEDNMNSFKTIIENNEEVFEEFADLFEERHRSKIFSMLIMEISKMSPGMINMGLNTSLGRGMIVDFIKDSLYDSSNIMTTELILETNSDKDYNILFLADLELDNLLQSPHELKDYIHKAGADILVLGGDTIANINDIEKIESYLRDIDIEHKYYVSGNHEHYLSNSDKERIHKIYKNVGFKNIDNKNINLKGFNIIGIDDVYSEMDDIESAYDGVNISNKLNLVFSHNHDINYKLDELSKKADLIMSGHTQGGQIDSFLVEMIKNTNVWKEQGFYKGEFEFNGTNLNYRNYTVNGLGGSGFPLRLGAQQEGLLLKVTSDGTYKEPSEDKNDSEDIEESEDVEDVEDGEELPEEDIAIPKILVKSNLINGVYNYTFTGQEDGVVEYSIDGGITWANVEDLGVYFENIKDGEYSFHFRGRVGESISDVVEMLILHENNKVSRILADLTMQKLSLRDFDIRNIDIIDRDLRNLGMLIHEDVKGVEQRDYLSSKLKDLNRELIDLEDYYYYRDNYRPSTPKKEESKKKEDLKKKDEAVKDDKVINVVKSTFKDIEKSKYKDEIAKLQELGFVTGVGNDLFKPESNLTRAEFVEMLVNGFKLKHVASQTYKDVNVNDWFYNSVSTATSMGIIMGNGDGTFNPNKPISREEVLVILRRVSDIMAFDFKEVGSLPEGLESFLEASTWAKKDVLQMVKLGVLEDQMINLKESPNREETAKYIYELLSKSDRIK